ncbi:MAG: TlpA family protein disulfide reductase [Bdellovibrionales bacterium]|nr:TlpA family protein disulfide reductase [Bdellovibrionales bacterium]
MDRIQNFLLPFTNRVYRMPRTVEWGLTFVGVFALTLLAQLGSELALPPFASRLDQSQIENRGVPVDGVITGDNGKSMQLSDLRKRVTILNFWSPDCGPCQGEMERLKKLKERMSEYGLEVIFIEAPTQASFWGAIQKQKPRPEGLASDPDQRLAKVLGVSTLPASLVLDREGRKTMVLSGPQNWNHPKFRAVVEDLLAESL